MKVLVTGAAGFLGSAIADTLIEEGHEVVGIDNLSTGRRENFPGHLIVGDIRERDHLVSALGDIRPDVIYHCAASYKDRDDWERDASTNVLGTINVVREAQKSNARIVYFQTSLCYGLKPASPVDLLAPLAPTGSYAVSKTAGESYIRDSGLDYVSLRLANIYGPRNLSGPVPAFYQRLSQGLPCTVVDSRRDFVFVDDLVGIALRALTDGRGIYHVASGSDVSIMDIYREVVQALRSEMPEPTVTPRNPDDAASILLDPTETREDYGWIARTPLASGIRQAVDYYRAFPPTETFTHLKPMRESNGLVGARHN